MKHKAFPYISTIHSSTPCTHMHLLQPPLMAALRNTFSSANLQDEVSIEHQSSCDRGYTTFKVQLKLMELIGMSYSMELIHLSLTNTVSIAL